LRKEKLKEKETLVDPAWNNKGCKFVLRGVYVKYSLIQPKRLRYAIAGAPRETIPAKTVKPISEMLVIALAPVNAF